MKQERFIWEKGNTTIEFKEPCITFLNKTYGKDFKEKTKDDMMYFYYDVDSDKTPYGVRSIGGV